MIQYGVELEADQGANYLRVACENDCLELVKFLASKGINLNSLDEHQNTALHFAARNGSRELIEFLLENSLDINAKNDEMRTPFLEACLFRNFRNMKLIEEKGGVRDCDLKDRNQNTPFHLYKFETIDDLPVFFFLLEFNLDLDAVDLNRDTVLMKACESDWTGHIVNEFLLRGVDINAVNNKGMTPFLFACNCSTKYNARLLARKGANVHARNNEGQNGLHLNARSERIFVIEELIELGINVNIADNNGDKFIHLFTRNTNEFTDFTRKILVEILKPAGLDFNAVDGEGRTALKLAKLHNCPKEYIDCLESLTLKEKPKSPKSSCTIQ